MPELPSFQYLVDPDAVREALIPFAGQPVIGLDTETFRDTTSGMNQLSLLQLASPDGRVVVIDALAAGIELARPLIEQASPIKAAHNARFDDGVLRGFGFETSGFVDTLKLSRRTLTLPSHSLASLAAHLFEIPLEKSYQLSDWRRRPLSREQLRYAAIDAVVALRLFLELSERLTSEGRWDAELRRATLRRQPDNSDSDHPGLPARKAGPTLRPLTSDERVVLLRLQQWRQLEASRERLPLYMICHDKTLDHLVIARPRSLDDLASIYGLGPARIARYGLTILACLAGKPCPS